MPSSSVLIVQGRGGPERLPTWSLPGIMPHVESWRWPISSLSLGLFDHDCFLPVIEDPFSFAVTFLRTDAAWKPVESFGL